MDFTRLRMGEIAAAIGGVVLVIALLLPAYSPNRENPNANIDGSRADASIWEAHMLIRLILLAAAVAPIVLVYIIARGHQLSWPRGELTAVIGLTAATLLFYMGIIDRPGEPSGEIELEIGWYGAMLGAILSTVGGALRSSETARTKKPPGVL